MQTSDEGHAVESTVAEDKRRREDRERRYRRSVVVALVLSALAHAAFFWTGGLDGIPIIDDALADEASERERPWTEEPIQVVQIREKTPPEPETEAAAAASASSAASAASSVASASPTSADAATAAPTPMPEATVVMDIRSVSELRSADVEREEEKRVRLEEFVPKSVRASDRGQRRGAFREASTAVGPGPTAGRGGGGHCSSPPGAINRSIGTTVLIGGR